MSATPQCHSNKSLIQLIACTGKYMCTIMPRHVEINNTSLQKQKLSEKRPSGSLVLTCTDSSQPGRRRPSREDAVVCVDAWCGAAQWTGISIILTVWLRLYTRVRLRASLSWTSCSKRAPRSCALQLAYFTVGRWRQLVEDAPMDTKLAAFLICQ